MPYYSSGGSTLEPQTTRLLQAIKALGLPPMHTLTPAGARALRQKTAHLGSAAEAESVGGVEDRTFEGPGGPVRIRVYTPKERAVGIKGSIAYFHGGGWVMGDLETHDAVGRGLANAAGMRVAAIDYRLAPEAPYPAALDDAWAATEWLAAEEDGLLVVAGDSAGGHLATCVAARARGTNVSIAAQVLIYPVTDLSSFDTPSYGEFADGFWLTRDAMVWFRDHFVPAGIDHADPDVSPLHRPSLSGMPPALVVAAECDVLRDEGLAYANRLRADGCDVIYRCYSGVIHGFVAMPGIIDKGADAIRTIGSDLRQTLGATEA